MLPRRARLPQNDRQYGDRTAPTYVSGLPATHRRERTELHLTQFKK